MGGLWVGQKELWRMVLYSNYEEEEEAGAEKTVLGKVFFDVSGLCRMRASPYM